MYEQRPSALRRFFSGIWTVIDTSRRIVFNLIFLLLLIAFASLFFGSSGLKIEEKTALVLNFKGPLVEQRTGGPRDRLLSEVRGGAGDQTQLRDVLAVLEAAAKDPKIDSAVLILDDFGGGGLVALREVAAALERFKAGGKKVVAWGSEYNQRRYFLAAHANEVYLHPMGSVLTEGYGGYRNYYKDALDKLGLSANVIRVGNYKNFGETYVANAPSKATIEADTLLYTDLWATYTSAVEKARKLPAGAINKGIEALPQSLIAVEGNAARLALESKQVDGLKTQDELRDLMIERGAKDEKNKTFRQVGFENYLSTLRAPMMGDAVGVVVAEGGIDDGDAPPGKVGGRSTSQLIRKARNDDQIKAIVLRVNSPGGSAVASEMIRRELELTRKAGKPVIVSMGNVAASGGYWISMSSDEVIADPATITGSIGVVAMLPTGEKAMEKLSIGTGGVTTTWLAGAYDPRRALDPRMAQMVQSVIGNIYTDFKAKAAAARKSTPEKIDEVAQGRVWTGNQAKERGLIDRLGSYTDAIKSAREKGKLGDDARTVYVEADRSSFERLLEQLGGASLMASLSDYARSAFAEYLTGVMPELSASGVMADAQRDLGWLKQIAERAKSGSPMTGYVHCLCVAE
ncbi:MAG: signal peptide peptidase SppA [Betaproteobacteria bacterium]|nr:signal peptide peptidase SppA [Betaproteobacteria bacterium]